MRIEGGENRSERKAMPGIVLNSKKIQENFRQNNGHENGNHSKDSDGSSASVPLHSLDGPC